MYFRYFAISRSIGTMFARMLRWVRTTPLGSAVAPEVKMISAVVSGVDASRSAREAASGVGRPDARRRSGTARARCQTGRASPSAATSTASPTRMACASTMAATLQQEVGRRAVVDRDEHDAFEQAPHSAAIHSGGSRSRSRPPVRSRCPRRADAPRTPRAAAASSRVRPRPASDSRRRRRGIRRSQWRTRSAKKSSSVRRVIRA